MMQHTTLTKEATAKALRAAGFTTRGGGSSVVDPKTGGTLRIDDGYSGASTKPGVTYTTTKPGEGKVSGAFAQQVRDIIEAEKKKLSSEENTESKFSESAGIKRDRI